MDRISVPSAVLSRQSKNEKGHDTKLEVSPGDTMAY
ncbi:MAG: hypothetical protein ACI9DH_001636 [Halioglobus sp.]